MDATVGAYGTAGLALVSAGVIAVAPVTVSLPDAHVATAAVQLTSGASASDAIEALTADLNYFDWGSLLEPQTLSNIAQNLLIDIVNIPYNWLKAVDWYSKAGLGYPGVYGTTGEPTHYDPQHPNPVLTGDPDNPAPDGYYAPIGMTGPDGNPEFVPVGFGGTGSWWMESTGNTWGWDEGNFGQVLGLSNMIVPIPQFSTPFGYSLQALAMQEVVANPQACPFECPDILGYLGRWFNVPFNDSVTGVEVGKNFPPGDAAAPEGSTIDPMGLPISWAGHTVKFDPFFFITSFLKSLAADPAGDPSEGIGPNAIADYASLLADPSKIIQPFWQIIQDLFNDFVPVLPGSFIYWGAPSFFTVPALVGGLISSFTGIANPMAPYTLAPGGAFALGPYLGQEIVGGEKLDLHTLFPDAVPLGHPITITEWPAGFATAVSNWIAGMFGYVDPYTYLHILLPDIQVGTTAEQLAQDLAGVLKVPASDLEGLAEGLYGWHAGLHDTVIGPLAQLSDTLAPWYTGLTVGMEGLLTELPV